MIVSGDVLRGIIFLGFGGVQDKERTSREVGGALM